MAQALSQTVGNTFVKGLITEASPLSFPKDASVDELNCVLERSGVRKRRPGIEFEEDFELSSFTTSTDDLIYTQTWKSVSNQPGTEFLVVQVGGTLYFYDKSQNPVSPSLKSFSVNLNDFYAGNNELVSENRISADSIEGDLIVVSNAIDPFFISYDPDTDSISTDTIAPKVRDFEWQGDTSDYYTPKPIGSTSQDRKYDTYNAGWVDEAKSGFGVLDSHKSSTDTYPSLNLPWFAGKNSFGNYSAPDWQRINGGTSLIGNGHYILDLFRKNRRQAVIDDPLTNDNVSIPTEVEKTRFTAVKGFAGRVWFAGLSSKKNGSKVFFSPVVRSKNDYGKFYQGADPTSEDFPDLIDSDGGTITISGATAITALFEMSGRLLVFAENGVWVISGPSSVFKATEFSVTKVSGAGGLLSPSALVDAEGTPVWWSTTGIFAGDIEDVSARVVGRDLSRTTIQTFFEDIPPEHRSRVTSVFDKFNKQVVWAYGSDSNNPYKINHVLILDLLLTAFVPWTFEDEDSSTDYVVGLSFFSGVGSTQQDLDVFAGSSDVFSGTSDVVTRNTSSTFDGPTKIRFLVRSGSTGRLSFATLTNNDFKDWGTADFTSFAETAYDFEESLSFRKNSIFVTTYFNVTETGFVGSDTTGYEFLNPSGCTLSSFWDLKREPSTKQSAYRFLRPIIVDETDLTKFDYPYKSVVTRNRVRGRGRVLSLRFESVPGKNFELQGYEVINARNTRL